MVRKKINAAILMAALTVSMLAGCGSQKDKQDRSSCTAIYAQETDQPV